MTDINLYFSQLKGMLKRNILLKKREKRKTIAEILLPTYFLCLLVVVKLTIPNPNFPEIITPRGEENLFTYFEKFPSHSIVAVPNTEKVKSFLNEIDETIKNAKIDSKIMWNTLYQNAEEVEDAYNKDPDSIPMALIFLSGDPKIGKLRYKIRTNPSFTATPSTWNNYDDLYHCRGTKNVESLLEIGCPTNMYYFSGFLALQTLIDYTRIRLDTNNDNIPEVSLEIFPKAAVTGDWSISFRLIIPLYLVLALSQFITFLMILIVGEKERKIKEGIKIMGLFDSVFWLSWFIIYAVFVLVLTITCVVLLFTLNVFVHTNYLIVFFLILLYGLSVIMFAFMITPFFDKSKTAGILSTFIIMIMSMLYYLQVYVSNTNPGYLWVLSLLSPAGFAMAIDKMVDLDFAGKGVNFSNIWMNNGSGLSVGGSLVMIMADIILYALLAYYLDSVIPSKHGVKRSPFFCFMPSFWKSKSRQFGLSQQHFDENIEPVTRDLQGREAIRITNLHKRFKQFGKPEVTALNGVNLTIYEGQITAILGHNGAGKTTLFNILTGLVSPTNGSAYVFGYNVSDSNGMDKIRKMTSVCPQHNILFDNLTPKEHLEFFASIKGVKDIRSAVDKTLRDIDLLDKIDTASRNLSGGQKRKLSIGIAIIGDPKIIILDEPTAGVDPFSRRHIWNVLQNIRHGKIILLTTHFMDEADILAERKAVISRGQVRCCGSSLFLKNKFGIGYHLTIVLKENFDENAIADLVNKYVQMADKYRRHGKELSFILPYNSVQEFATLFSAIEEEIKKKSELGISSYGVSMTTLEEVFLRLQKEENKEDDPNNGGPVTQGIIAPTESGNYQQLHASTSSLDYESGNVADSLQSLESTQYNPRASQILVTLFKLRVLRLWREKRKTYSTILLPIVLAALGLYLNQLNTIMPPSRTSISLNLKKCLYSLPIGIHNGTTSSLDDFTNNLAYIGAQTDAFDGNFTSLLDTAPHSAAFNVTKFDDSASRITVLYNDTLLHSLPALINIINNVFYGLSSKNSYWSAIEVKTHPFEKITNQSYASIKSGNFILGMIFLFAPVILSVDMVYDREIKARNQLRVNGLSFWLYFISFFLVQIAIFSLIIVALLVLIIIFNSPSLSSGPPLIVLVVFSILYCPASVLFTTCVSYMFDKSDTAQSLMSNISFILGILPYVPIAIAAEKTASILHILFSFLDVLYVPYGILHYIQKVDSECQAANDCTTPILSDYMTKEIILIFVALLIQIPIWFFLLLVFDVKKNGGSLLELFKITNAVNDNMDDDIVKNEIDISEDQDVKDERQRVKTLMETTSDHPPVVIVENLHKVYRMGVKSKLCDQSGESGKFKHAIRSLSLAVDAGEVFGLLGHNGAGKTTTMKIITAEEAPTVGRVNIAGNSITSNVNAAFRVLGYCPQHDAQWKNITVKEHLEIYAVIRGVPKRDIKRTVNLYLSGLQIHEHKDKQSEKCSGGTMRKLSYAMAMIGNPKVVLLDEPSTGMDPESKRFLWNTVLASFKGSKGAILTTHSMEEADALCSRVGIMVNGELRCLGSIQHLKNLYGAGYNLEIKLIVGEASYSRERLTKSQDFILSLFPKAVLEESFADRLMFSVPQDSVSSLAKCFKSLEEAKDRLNIEEYSFSQTTLEQVFLKFAYEGESEDNS